LGWYVVGKALYPNDHPYNWQVIGSLDDLDAASLQDTKDFYARWYVPNNVTVTITGDFDISEAKAYVKKYFGEIPRGEDIEPHGPRPGELSETVKLIHEDNFAVTPSNAGTDLDELLPAIDKAFARFEEKGIPQSDLDEIKNEVQVGFFNNFNSALTKAIALSEYNLFTDDPEFYKQDLAGYLNVSREDVMRVYETYIKGKPAVITSFVPKGKPELGIEGSAKADVVEEVIVDGEGAAVDFDPWFNCIGAPE